MTNHKLSCLLFFVLGLSLYLPTFAQLPGPVSFGTLGSGAFINSTGWQLLSDGVHLAPQALDTNGDTDAFPNELILTPNAANYGGAAFYSSQLDATANCDFWIADFDFRIFEGTTPGDGMAFVVTTAIPTTAASGGNLGLPPGGFTGFAVCFDTYDNCGIANPAVEIRYNSTDECATGPEVTLPNLRQNLYHTCRVIYNSGTIDVYIDGSTAPVVSGSYNLTTPVFLGFSAGTGGATDAHSVKNVNFYLAPGAAADAGADQTLCSSGNVTLGVPNQPALPYVYNWTPTTGLSSSTISNPSLSLNNTNTLPDTSLYTVNTSIGTCATKDSAYLIVIPYPAVPSISASSSQICQGDSVTLIASQASTGNTILNWYDAAVGGNFLFSGYIYQTPPINATTTFYAEAINDNLCAATRQPITITVIPAPTAPTVNVPPICGGQDGVFHATAPANMIFTWYTVPTGGTPVFTGTNLNIGTMNSDTTLYVSSTNATGCTSITRTQAILSVLPTPPAAQANGDTICVGTAATLSIVNPQAGLTYKWYKNTTATSALGTGNTFVTPALSLNTYYFVESNNLGCAGARSAVLVTVTQLPAPPVAIADTICPNEPAILRVLLPKSNLKYEWYSTLTSTNPLVIDTILITTPLTSTTNFYVQSVAGECRSASRTPVKGLVDIVPPAPVGLDKSVCLGGQVDLYVVPNPNFTAQWQDLNGLVIHEGDSYHLTTVMDPQTFVLYGISRLAGCTSFWTDTIRLTISPPPSANFEIIDDYDTPLPYIIKDTVEVGELANFISTSTNAYTYTWNFGNGWYANSTVNGSNKPQFAYTKEGEFPVKLLVSNKDGCVDSITKIVYVENIREIFVPTAFSPNGDGFNEEVTFTSSKNLWNFSIKIFDRWGKEVYSTTNLSDTWKGHYGKYGDYAPEGVYTWMAEFEIADHTKRVKSGTITLIR